MGIRLDAAQIDADLALPAPGIGRLAQIMRAAAHIRPGWWRRPRARRPNGRPAAAASSSASVARAIASSIAVAVGGRNRVHGGSSLLNSQARIIKDRDACANRAAPLSPDGSRPRWWRAGRSAVQSPARNRLRQRVRAAGRRASCAGVAAKVARRSLTICQARQRPSAAVHRRDLGPERRGQLLARRCRAGGRRR